MPVRDGSIIFWQDGFLVKPIMKNTGSNIVHVAIVLYENDGPYVYEATWPRVRKMPLADYLQLLADKRFKHVPSKRGFRWFMMQPREEYTPKQLESMKQYARSQLGRRYMMRGWWKNKEVRGIMCSQFVGNCIEKSGKIKSANFKESPVSLKEKVETFYEGN
ncbi:MAG: YiiX/YebB-like N1pC/P60 family cysteine hydrolase [Candidatus Omnitrophota bacterium]|jgi:hypothetical protein